MRYIVRMNDCLEEDMSDVSSVTIDKIELSPEALADILIGRMRLTIVGWIKTCCCLLFSTFFVIFWLWRSGIPTVLLILSVNLLSSLLIVHFQRETRWLKLCASILARVTETGKI